MVDYYNILAEGQDFAEAAQRARAPLFRDAEIQAALDALSRRRSP